MPRPTYSSTTYALVRALHAQGGFSEREIAAITGHKRSAVHHLIVHQAKSRPPSDLDSAVVQAAISALAEARLCGMRALARSLRDAADRIDAAHLPPQSGEALNKN